jgi:SAM-dependent methyltransferase
MTMTQSFSPAADRNKYPIYRVLTALLPPRARVLEVGSGTGQHAAFFTRQRPDLEWWATDQDHRVDDLKAVARSSGMPPPFRVQALDVGRNQWPEARFDMLYSANTLHIMPWSHTACLIEGAVRVLVPGGLLACYGPFKEHGRHNADSNARFDRDLRARDPEMGIRDLADIRQLGERSALPVRAEISLPANNRLIVFEKMVPASADSHSTRRRATPPSFPSR